MIFCHADSQGFYPPRIPDGMKARERREAKRIVERIIANDYPELRAA